MVLCGQDVDADGGLVAGPVDGALGVVLGDRPFDDTGSGADAPFGHEVGQDAAADGADEVDDGVGDDGVGDDARGLDDQVAGPWPHIAVVVG